MAKEYTVVENAGYERENDRRSFATAEKAYAWLKANYESDEIESLHVEVALDIDGSRTYEF